MSCSIQSIKAYMCVQQWKKFCPQWPSCHYGENIFCAQIGNVSIVTGENIKPSYGGDDEVFLRKVISPLYRVIEKEANKSRNGKAPHSAWWNYDDLNEYFWI